MRKKIGIVGLGYVGLPLAIEFAKKYSVIGYDINQSRVSDLQKSFDKTLEVEKSELLEAKSLAFTSNLLGVNVNLLEGVGNAFEAIRTGEINLFGNISQIGGLEFKVMGALKANVKTIIYPTENQEDIDKIIIKYPLTSSLNFISASNIREILNIVFLD